MSFLRGLDRSTRRVKSNSYLWIHNELCRDLQRCLSMIARSKTRSRRAIIRLPIPIFGRVSVARKTKSPPNNAWPIGSLRTPFRMFLSLAYTAFLTMFLQALITDSRIFADSNRASHSEHSFGDMSFLT